MAITILCSVSFLLTVLATAAESASKSKPGPMTGTWECMAHGGSQGDLAFTLYLEQSKDVVTGSVSSPMGGADISSGTFREKTLEIQIDSQNGRYVVVGKLKKGQLSGTWSLDDVEKGTWEGKRVSRDR